MLLKPDKLPTFTSRYRPVSLIIVGPDQLLPVGLVWKPQIPLQNKSNCNMFLWADYGFAMKLFEQVIDCKKTTLKQVKITNDISNKTYMSTESKEIEKLWIKV